MGIDQQGGLDAPPQALDIKNYHAVMPKYMHWGSPEKYQMRQKHFGWKLHLNVLPQNVQHVSEFLKGNGYTHKYLNTGNDETESGKIFTIYIGPKTLTEEGIRDISDKVGSLLISPKAKGEQLVAPNMIARFDTDHNVPVAGLTFARYGYLKGIPFLDYYNEDDPEGAITQSRTVLMKEFGDFFGGSLATYKL